MINFVAIILVFSFSQSYFSFFLWTSGLMSKATCPICSKEFSQRKITVSSSEIQNFVTIEFTFIQSLFVTNQKQIYYPKTIQLTFYFYILFRDMSINVLNCKRLELKIQDQKHWRVVMIYMTDRNGD